MPFMAWRHRPPISNNLAARFVEQLKQFCKLYPLILSITRGQRIFDAVGRVIVDHQLFDAL